MKTCSSARCICTAHIAMPARQAFLCSAFLQHFRTYSVTQRCSYVKSYKIFPRWLYFPQVCNTLIEAKVHRPRLATCRFYIMRLPARGLRFHRITFHGKVTQCLGGLTPPHHWYDRVHAAWAREEGLKKIKGRGLFKSVE